MAGGGCGLLQPRIDGERDATGHRRTGELPAGSDLALGDGGLAMLLGDLLTIRQMKLPIKIVVSGTNRWPSSSWR